MVTIPAADPRYPDVQWGANQRWIGRPDRVHLPHTPRDVVAALQNAADFGDRVAARSGGHCYEDFVGSPDVQTVIDLRHLSGVSIDRASRSFAVGAGARLGDLYSQLYLRWGVTLPGGSCPTVGVGGHVVGGGFGPLSRAFGLTVDHLHAVEVAVVDAAGQARLVRASRDPHDPHHDLWWAHTGGGGGNFGIVTRYFFASPERGSDPREWLPRPPSHTYVQTLGWAWPMVDRDAFSSIMTNFATFFADQAGPDTEFAEQFSQLNLASAAAGGFALTTMRDGTKVDAQERCAEFAAYVQQGTQGQSMILDDKRLPWLHIATQWPGLAAADTTTCFKGKSAYLRRPMSADSLDAYYLHLNRDDYSNPTCGAMLMSHGGVVNMVDPDQTAVYQRDSIVKINYNVFWPQRGDADAEHVRWLREFYRDVHASTGGVPVRGETYDGTFINYADVDLRDPAWNTSGVPWHDLYYGQNYSRLQRVKDTYDPQNVFRHGLSIGH